MMAGQGAANDAVLGIEPKSSIVVKKGGSRYRFLLRCVILPLCFARWLFAQAARPRAPARRSMRYAGAT
ncbi:hypothetical protein WM40_07915 [Robbsia andropogonis]|uniref:Uncharacterized protein n=1 Tax=Robbsia andropogonis TaxID=28092 RepID=A0A0F5K1M5_9BURK|nr:hypothetical protein WM40_07915 [Robbsia andropogonis]